jgi:hypothetical protein
VADKEITDQKLDHSHEPPSENGFCQVFTIFGYKNHQYIPLVFCILEDKTTSSYEKCFLTIGGIEAYP